jgi:hypothetical protein
VVLCNRSKKCGEAGFGVVMARCSALLRRWGKVGRRSPGAAIYRSQVPNRIEDPLKILRGFITN